MKSIYFLPLILLFFACSYSDDGQNNNEDVTPTDDTIPLSIYQKIYKSTNDIYIDGGYVYISTNCVPDHKSPYFLGTEWENEQYAGSVSYTPLRAHET